jgi:uncharacterized protein (DUF1800 family)
MPNSLFLQPAFSCRSLVALILTSQMMLPTGLLAQANGQMAGSMENSSDRPIKMNPVDPAKAHTQIDADERILHVLNRFTYGPRPGDVERVKTMGISAWFKQQMDPLSIDDGALDKKLADFPAMSMPLDKMMEAYPTRQMIQQMARGKIGKEPGGAAERAIYNDEMAREQEKKAGGKGKPMDSDAANAQWQDEAQNMLAMPPAKRFAELCKYSPSQLQQLKKALRGEDRDKLTAGFTPKQMEEFAAFQNPQGVVAEEATETKLLRDIYSERQLNEVMVDFWLNHFSVYIKKSQQAPYYIAAYERDSIRPQALGKFEYLLLASAMSPAMLNYLDNSSSIGPHSRFANQLPGPRQKKAAPAGLNENYARELMELHTLGVGGGYTQHDVTEVAKVFTGWTVAPQRDPFNSGYARRRDGTILFTDRGVQVPTQAEFDESKHEPGTKTVLGVKIKENGEKEGLEVLHMLATSPATAKFVSQKLAVRFVSDDPPQAMVDKMAATFTKTSGDIRQVLLTMVNSPEFWTQETYRAKLKTPQEFVVSALRASNADVTSPSALVGVIADLGMPIYGMLTPNGYSMKADPWNNTGSLVARMNFALSLSANRVPGVTTNWPALLGPHDQPLTAEAKDAQLEAKLLHVPVSERTRQTILTQISTDAEKQEASLKNVPVQGAKRQQLLLRPATKPKDDMAETDPQASLAAGLLFGSPEFQRR